MSLSVINDLVILCLYYPRLKIYDIVLPLQVLIFMSVYFFIFFLEFGTGKSLLQGHVRRWVAYTLRAPQLLKAFSKLL